MDKNQVNHLLSPEVEAQAQRKMVEHKADEAASQEAAATAFPGALAELAEPANMLARSSVLTAAGTVVKEWSIRPLVAVDILYFTRLGSAFAKFIKDGQMGRIKVDPVTKAASIPDELLEGPDAWAIAWLLTHTVDEADDMLMDKPGGERVLAKAARKEFGSLQAGPLHAIVSKCLAQVGRYWSTVLEHVKIELDADGNAKTEGGSEGRRPPSSGGPTGSGGGSTT